MQIEQYKEWKHFSDRDPKRPIKYLVVHSFALSVKDMIAICDKLAVGPHYMIDNKGNISQFVREDKLARHAGKSFWGGEESLNATSIGIELYSPSFGQKPYSKAQIKTFISLAKKIIKKYHIRPENVIGHSDIAPMRKVDPGIAFPWKQLAMDGIGIWPEKKDKTSRKKAKTLLREIGYDVSDEKAALLAFMRHFMPEYIREEGDVFKMEEMLPVKIKKMPRPDKNIMSCLNNVAWAYSQARSKHTAKIKK